MTSWSCEKKNNNEQQKIDSRSNSIKRTTHNETNFPVQSQHVVIWNSRFQHQNHWDFVKHLINVLIIFLKRFKLRIQWRLIFAIVMLCYRLKLWVGKEINRLLTYPRLLINFSKFWLIWSYVEARFRTHSLWNLHFL